MSHPRTNLTLCAALFSVLLAGLALRSALANPPVDPSHDQARIMRAISSSAPKQVEAQIAELKITATSDPGFAIGMLRGPVLRALIDHGHFAEAADLAVLGVEWNFNDLGSIQQLERLRIEALTRAHRTTEALAAAKGLFNVCSMHDTEQMLQVLAETINAAHPGDPNAAQPMVDQEVAGASAANESTAVVSAVVKSLPIDSAFKQKADEHRPGSYLIPSDEWSTINSQVNLLLLADQPAEAEKMLRALRKTDHSLNLHEVDEAIARTLRAEDGTIGRANAYVRARNAEYAAE